MDPKILFEQWRAGRSRIFINRKNPPTDICKITVTITADLSSLQDRYVGAAIHRISGDFQNSLMDELESYIPSIIDEYVSNHPTQKAGRYKIDCRVESPEVSINL
jgi:hypothetical protein